MAKRAESVEEWLERVGASAATRALNEGKDKELPQVDVALFEGMTHKELQAFVEREARLRGYLHYHTHTSRHSEPGFPDSVIINSQEILYAELKVGTKDKVRPAQRKYLDAIALSQPDRTYLWTEKDINEIRNILIGMRGAAEQATLWVNRRSLYLSESA